LADMTRTAPSMIAAPQSMVAMSVSWPGESTKETVRRTSVSAPQWEHFSSTVKASGSGQLGHLRKVASAYPRRMEMPLLTSSLC